MATAAQARAEINEWLATAPGLWMDGDQAHGYQCKDVADDYASKLFGVKPGVALGYGDAKRGLELANKKYFTVVKNDPDNPDLLPPDGSIIVWGGTEKGGLNEFGHIAVVKRRSKTSVTVIQQDGFLQVAAHIATLGYWNEGTGYCLGWLVPKAAMVVYTGADTRGFGPTPAATVAVQASRSYQLVTTTRSKNYTPAAFSRSVFGADRRILGITIHWWDTPARAGTLATTTAWLSRPGGDSSAHAVISGTVVNEIVSPADVAWHAGQQGNVVTVGIECDPRNIAATLPTIIAYCADLERKYGSLLFYGHRDWMGTECPGDYYGLLSQIIGGVNAALATTTKPAAVPVAPARPAPAAPAPAKPAPAKPAEPAWSATDKALVTDINGNVRRLRDVLTFRFSKYEKGLTRVSALELRIAAMQKQLDSLTKEK